MDQHHLGHQVQNEQGLCEQVVDGHPVSANCIGDKRNRTSSSLSVNELLQMICDLLNLSCPALNVSLAQFAGSINDSFHLKTRPPVDSAPEEVREVEEEGEEDEDELHPLVVGQLLLLTISLWRHVGIFYWNIVSILNQTVVPRVLDPSFLELGRCPAGNGRSEVGLEDVLISNLEKSTYIVADDQCRKSKDVGGVLEVETVDEIIFVPLVGVLCH